jgi:polar amino acid transport system substrate-binding protein
MKHHLLRRRLSFCLIFLAPLWNACHAVTLATEEYPPFNYVDEQTKKIIGISADKVNIMMQRAKIDYTVESFPWTRAFQMAQQSSDTCVFSTVRNPERENLFRWIGPLGKNDWMIYVRSTSAATPKDIEDLRPYTIGVYRNSAIGTYLQQLGFTLDWANYDVENPRKLVYGRFDYWASSDLMGQYNINKTGLRGQITPLFKFHTADMYLACNLGIPATTVDRLNQILKEMDKDGTSSAIDRKYRTVANQPR